MAIERTHEESEIPEKLRRDLPPNCKRLFEKLYFQVRTLNGARSGGSITGLSSIPTRFGLLRFNAEAGSLHVGEKTWINLQKNQFHADLFLAPDYSLAKVILSVRRNLGLEEQAFTLTGKENALDDDYFRRLFNDVYDYLERPISPIADVPDKNPTQKYRDLCTFLDQSCSRIREGLDRDARLCGNLKYYAFLRPDTLVMEKGNGKVAKISVEKDDQTFLIVNVTYIQGKVVLTEQGKEREESSTRVQPVASVNGPTDVSRKSGGESIPSFSAVHGPGSK